MTTRPVGNGTGFGLNLCHRIMRAHNGIIDIEIETRFYTLVTIDFPPSDPKPPLLIRELSIVIETVPDVCH